ncbi:MAG: hypothetical protein JWO05_1177 [Gemmatimonadetes bacterium]|nr:hypothetical protein [Gemmatimonadota bacterium]
MKKAIELELRLWVEGDAEPAADFAKITTAAVREMVRTGAKAQQGLTVKVKSLREVGD